MMILLYVIDCLRSDFLYLYGYEDRRLLNFKKFIEDSAVYENAYGVSSWTKGAADSILTSQWPTSLGVLSKVDKMPEYNETLQNVLRYNGIESYAVSTNGFFSEAFGHTGFNNFYLISDHNRTSADEVNRFILPMIESCRDKKIFLMSWIGDTHTPYNLHVRKKFFGNTKAASVTPEDITRLSVRRIKQLYYEAVSFIDSAFGEVLSKLKQMHLYEGSMIIVTADHGSGFGEHRRLTGRPKLFHGDIPFEEEIHIPLIVKYPKNILCNTKVNNLVQLIDIYPTILEVCGIAPKEGIEGISLLQNKQAARTSDRAIFVKTVTQTPTIQMIREGFYKLIKIERKYKLSYNPRKLIAYLLHRYFLGHIHFYNLKEDPLEKKNLWKKERRNVDILLGKLALLEGDCQRKAAKLKKTIYKRIVRCRCETKIKKPRLYLE